MELADDDLASKQSSSNIIYPQGARMRRMCRRGAELLGSAVDNNNNPSKRSDRPKQEERRVEANERWDDDECDMNGLVDGTANALCALLCLACFWPATGLAMVCCQCC